MLSNSSQFENARFFSSYFKLNKYKVQNFVLFKINKKNAKSHRRFVFAANAIVALYSLFEMGVSVWEISTGATLFPEILQVWFDFGHDQVLYAYINPKFENVFFLIKFFLNVIINFF